MRFANCTLYNCRYRRSAITSVDLHQSVTDARETGGVSKLDVSQVRQSFVVVVVDFVC
jgi:hypothetical protein